MHRTKILISGISLPPKVVGSWLFRIHKFQSNLDYFDFVLSPTQNPDDKYIFCQKQPPKIFHKLQNSSKKSFYSAGEYIAFCKGICRKGSPVQIVVMDDTSLLDGISQLKEDFPVGSELVFSFHGHWLSAPSHVLDKVDKVFFLTRDGYRKTLNSNFQFTPQTYIVGNGVESEKFYPLKPAEKMKLKGSLGFEEQDTVLVWMANSRRVKGLHLFKKIAAEILRNHPAMKVISIGHQIDASITHPNWKQIGLLNHDQLPKYLQIGDIYFFTSLWQEGFGLSLVEAIKCGNWALASNLGGIPEVLADQSRALIVKDPNILESWLEAFEEVRMKIKTEEIPNYDLKDQLDQWHNYDTWEATFFNALST
jgi:glycosyltransferase involved in cell wall biosynthesis